jgi:hypothetical protein
MMIQNGSTPFVHPVTGMRIGPFEFYEGNAHQEHENVVEEELNKDDKEQFTGEDSTQQDAEKPKGKKKQKEEE